MVRIKYKEAAGLEVKKGKPSIGRKPERKKLQRLYIKESKSIREVAKVLGCSKDMVYRTLQEYGIKRRERLYNSILNKYSLEYLKKEVKNKGFKQVAFDLKVDVHTLRVHFNRRKNKESHNVA